MSEVEKLWLLSCRYTVKIKILLKLKNLLFSTLCVAGVKRLTLEIVRTDYKNWALKILFILGI